MTPHPQQENPDMICAAFHRISVVQPENCYNCVHRHGYPQYLFGDDNCDSFITKTPAPAAPNCDNCAELMAMAREHGFEAGRNQTLDEVKDKLKKLQKRFSDEEMKDGISLAESKKMGAARIATDAAIKLTESLRTPSTQEHE